MQQLPLLFDNRKAEEQILHTKIDMKSKIRHMLTRLLSTPTDFGMIEIYTEGMYN